MVKKHPNTIKIYTEKLLGFFGNIEALGSNGYFKIPIIYANREKLLDIKEQEFAKLVNGNTNFLPRASLSLESISYDNNRHLNKNLFAYKQDITQQNLAEGTVDVMLNPVPYNISYSLSIVVRGMEQATMIAEQICSRFAPFLSLGVEDFMSKDGPSEVKVALDSVSFNVNEAEQFSSNEIVIDMSFNLIGNLFSGIRTDKIAKVISLETPAEFDEALRQNKPDKQNLIKITPSSETPKQIKSLEGLNLTEAKSVKIGNPLVPHKLK